MSALEIQGEVQNRIRRIVGSAIRRMAETDDEDKKDGENRLLPAYSPVDSFIGTGVFLTGGQECRADVSIAHQLSPVVSIADTTA